MGVVVAAVVSAVVVALLVYAKAQRLSPDGEMYYRAAHGAAVPVPFSLRPAMPWLCGSNATTWRVVSWLSVPTASACVAAIASVHGASDRAAATAGILFAGLPIVRTIVTIPVLVDGPALALTALSALLALTGHGWAAAIVAIVGAAVKEHVPVFAALAAMSAWPLLGVVVTALLWVLRRHAAPDHPNLAHPLAYARAKQSDRWFDPTLQILPWGACVAVLFGLTPAAVVSLVVAYALLATAADSTRVYQWAAIPVCVAAAAVIPEWAAVPVLVAHLWNPWQGSL